VINPESDVNYVLTVTGAPNTPQVVQTVSFAVTPVTAEFSVSPNPVTILAGPNQATLAWTTQAQVVSIDQGIGNVDATGGQQVLNAPVSGTMYTLTAGTTQNPALQTVQVTIAPNQYGPYTFTEFNVQPSNVQYTNTITFNTSIDFADNNYLNVQFGGISIGRMPNTGWPHCLILPGGQLSILCYTIAQVEWIDPQNQQGTVTILGNTF
jgi:hypothetical protein